VGGRPADELSILRRSIDPARSRKGLAGAAGRGPLSFQSGILAAIASVLADKSIFALSTYDTDYILVRVA
jgi:hypothetical protein